MNARRLSIHRFFAFYLLRTCVFIILFFAIIASVYAQNGVLIGPTAGTANASAMLEVSSTNKGLLLPRVNLVALANGTTPINAPAPGLLVYNLGGGGVPAVGIYYWDGSANAWVQLTSGGLSGSGTTNQLAKWTSSSAIGNSLIFDDNTYVGVGNTNPLGMLDVKGSGTTSATYGFGVRNNADVYNFAIADDGIVTVTSLAGAGLRPVFADVNGTLSTALTGTVVQMVAIQTRTAQVLTALNTGLGSQITNVNIPITPRKAGNMVVLEWVLSAEVSHDAVYMVTRDGVALANATNGTNNRWAGVASHPYDNDQNSTMSNVKIRIVDLNSLATATTYAVWIRSSNGSQPTFTLNRCIGLTGQDSYENGLSTGTATEIYQ
jgi:hypothetical protein